LVDVDVHPRMIEIHGHGLAGTDHPHRAALGRGPDFLHDVAAGFAADRPAGALGVALHFTRRIRPAGTDRVAGTGRGERRGDGEGGGWKQLAHGELRRLRVAGSATLRERAVVATAPCRTRPSGSAIPGPGP